MNKKVIPVFITESNIKIAVFIMEGEKAYEKKKNDNYTTCVCFIDNRIFIL